MTRKFNIHGDIKPNEAFTETLANLINIGLISHQNDYEDHDIKKMLDNETRFSMIQAAKIARTFNCNNIEQLLDGSLRQSTSIFSYYIIKSSMLYNIDSVLPTLGTTGNISSFKRNISLVDNQDFRATVNRLIPTVTHNNANRFADRSLRMTAYDATLINLNQSE